MEQQRVNMVLRQDRTTYLGRACADTAKQTVQQIGYMAKDNLRKNLVNSMRTAIRQATFPGDDPLIVIDQDEEQVYIYEPQESLQVDTIRSVDAFLGMVHRTPQREICFTMSEHKHKTYFSLVLLAMTSNLASYTDNGGKKQDLPENYPKTIDELITQGIHVRREFHVDFFPYTLRTYSENDDVEFCQDLRTASIPITLGKYTSIKAIKKKTLNK